MILQDLSHIKARGVQTRGSFSILVAVPLLAKCWQRSDFAANRCLQKGRLDGNAWLDCGSQGVRLLTLAVLTTKAEGLTIPPGFVSRMAPPNLKKAHVCKVLEFVGKTEFFCQQFLANKRMRIYVKFSFKARLAGFEPTAFRLGVLPTLV